MLQPTNVSGAAGSGIIELHHVAGRTAITQCQANSPLKLLTPKSPGTNAWIFTSTYGGGLVDGDSIDLRVQAHAGTRVLLTTQASTKIYRSEQFGCTQTLKVNAQARAVIVSIPDPIVCFEGADFSQLQNFHLAADANLVVVDWFTSGRKARGERWAFKKYRSLTEISVEQNIVFRDVLLLDPEDGPIDGSMRMGRIDCFATVVVMGPQLLIAAQTLRQTIAEQPARGDGSVIFSASPLAGGVVMRVAGTELEAVCLWLRKILSDIEPVLGQNPWMRKM